MPNRDLAQYQSDIIELKRVTLSPLNVQGEIDPALGCKGPSKQLTLTSNSQQLKPHVYYVAFLPIN